MFATQGFHKTTVAQICKAAKANIAAVNYHFGDKQKLYEASWDFALETVREDLKSSLDVGPIEDRFKEFYYRRLRSMSQGGGTSCFWRLILREMLDPTPSLAALSEKTMPVLRSPLSSLISELTGIGEGPRLKFLVDCAASPIVFHNLTANYRRIILQQKEVNETELQRMASELAMYTIGALKSLKEN